MALLTNDVVRAALSQISKNLGTEGHTFVMSPDNPMLPATLERFQKLVQSLRVRFWGEERPMMNGVVSALETFLLSLGELVDVARKNSGDLTDTSTVDSIYLLFMELAETCNLPEAMGDRLWLYHNPMRE